MHAGSGGHALQRRKPSGVPDPTRTPSRLSAPPNAQMQANTKWASRRRLSWRPGPWGSVASRICDAHKCRGAGKKARHPRPGARLALRTPTPAGRSDGIKRARPQHDTHAARRTLHSAWTWLMMDNGTMGVTKLRQYSTTLCRYLLQRPVQGSGGEGRALQRQAARVLTAALSSEHVQERPSLPAAAKTTRARPTPRAPHVTSGVICAMMA